MKGCEALPPPSPVRKGLRVLWLHQHLKGLGEETGSVQNEVDSARLRQGLLQAREDLWPKVFWPNLDCNKPHFASAPPPSPPPTISASVQNMSNQRLRSPALTAVAKALALFRRILGDVFGSGFADALFAVLGAERWYVVGHLAEPKLEPSNVASKRPLCLLCAVIPGPLDGHLIISSCSI